MGVLFQNTLLHKKRIVMEKDRSEAPRGMLFQIILEPLGRQFVKNGGVEIFVCFWVFLENRKGVWGPSRKPKTCGGVGPFN